MDGPRSGIDFHRREVDTVREGEQVTDKSILDFEHAAVRLEQGAQGDHARRGACNRDAFGGEHQVRRRRLQLLRRGVQQLLAESAEAPITAAPPSMVARLPNAPMPSGIVSVSPCSTVMRSYGRPRWLAHTWASTVSTPCPTETEPV